MTGVDEELARLLKDGVKTDELEKAKTGYLQQQQVMRTMDAMLAASLAENLYLGRTMQFQADLEQKIKTLTPEAVDAALRKHLDPKRLSIVTAGDFGKKKWQFRVGSIGVGRKTAEHAEARRTVSHFCLLPTAYCLFFNIREDLSMLRRDFLKQTGAVALTTATASAAVTSLSAPFCARQRQDRRQESDHWQG